MTTFVLVHGGWHGAWCWQRVAGRLRAAGHEVYTPTLSGLGDAAHQRSASINLSTHITDVVNMLVNENLSDVVLVGHSYGGGVITGVVDAQPDRITRLVYLDAIVPENGQSFADIFPEYSDAHIQSAADHDGIWVPPVPAAVFNVNEGDRDMVDRLCTPMSLAAFIERISLTGAGYNIPRTFVWASDWTPNPFLQFRDKYQDDKRWTIVEVATGHDVMLDAPDLVAQILAEAR